MKEKSKGLQIFNKIITWFLIGITSILVIIAGWLCIDKFIRKSTVPTFLGYASLTVATGSMSGTIEKGDFIIVKKTNDYKIGDIITYAHPGEKIPTTHRIIQITPEGDYVTKGDANNAQDVRTVTKKEIVGEVVAVWHYFGIFVGWLLNGGGFIYILAVLIIIALAVYLLKKFQATKKPEGHHSAFWLFSFSSRISYLRRGSSRTSFDMFNLSSPHSGNPLHPPILA